MISIKAVLKTLFLSFVASLVCSSTLLASLLPEDNQMQPKNPASLVDQCLDFIINNINTPNILSQLDDRLDLEEERFDFSSLSQEKLVILSEKVQKTQADEYVKLKNLIQKSWENRKFKVASDESVTKAVWLEYNKLPIEERGEIDILAELDRNMRENRERAISHVLTLNLPRVSFRGVYFNEHELWRISLKSRGLRSLDLSHSKVSDKELALDCHIWSTCCTTLERLDISNTKIKFNTPIATPLTCVLELSARATWIDSGLLNCGIKNMISVFPNLSMLDLSESNYLHSNTAWLTLLCPLTGLTDLSIAKCKLTNAHLQHLNALTSLTKLDFSNNLMDPQVKMSLVLPKLLYIKWDEDWYIFKHSKSLT